MKLVQKFLELLINLFGIMCLLLIITIFFNIITGYNMFEDGLHPFFKNLKQCMITVRVK